MRKYHRNEKIRFVEWDKHVLFETSELGAMGGFFMKGMRWRDYLFTFMPEIHCRLFALKDAIIKENIKCTGSEHQNHHGNDMATCPVFEDNTCATYSLRSWGDLMAAIWSEEEDYDYSYMDFYI